MGENKPMQKQLELSSWDAGHRLLLFLKHRKGKVITDQTFKDFDKLLDKLRSNFKHHDSVAISKGEQSRNEAIEMALDAIRAQFMCFEKGGNCRISDIDNFALYVDKKYKASIKGKLEEITHRDYCVLRFIFLGHL